jgi:hypothetical protein
VKAFVANPGWTRRISAARRCTSAGEKKCFSCCAIEMLGGQNRPSSVLLGTALPGQPYPPTTKLNDSIIKPPG